MDEAVSIANEGGTSLRGVARLYNVPVGTLRQRIIGVVGSRL